VVSKIALEEHFVPEHQTDLITNPGWSAEAWNAVLDALTDTERRLEQMDRLGIERAVLSLGSNGIQDVLDPAAAVVAAREANDALARVLAAHPDRYSAFAALPMQDVDAAIVELERCVSDLGFAGVLVNGYTSSGSLEQGTYYDEERFAPFWARVEQLAVPFYLHPRNPLPGQRRIYAGTPQLLGPTWAFGVETATHALRLLVSGLFDRHPKLTVILGHLGEMLPFAVHRLEQRLLRRPDNALLKPASAYLRENFYITTSGNYHTASLIGILLELGSEKLLFAADYPFEEMADGAHWLDAVPVSERDRERIAHTNARELLGLRASTA
jgi:predicted TIM-barrel fold metal-dependent hydrolase